LPTRSASSSRVIGGDGMILRETGSI
jgi:hypothetical protein